MELDVQDGVLAHGRTGDVLLNDRWLAIGSHAFEIEDRFGKAEHELTATPVGHVQHGIVVLRQDLGRVPRKVAVIVDEHGLPGVRVHAAGELRHGPLLEVLESAAREEGADAIAFGRPAGIDSSFSLTDLQRLAAQIEEDTGIKTCIL